MPELSKTKLNEISKRKTSPWVDGLKVNARQYSMFIALVAIWLMFTALTGGTFLSARNLSNLFVQNSFIAILAVGMVLVIVAGHIDLSVGSIAGFAGGIAAMLNVGIRSGETGEIIFRMGTWESILVAMIAGLLIGVWQGYWIAFQGIPAFIVTLAGMLVFRGLLIAMTGGQTITPLEDSFKALGQNYIPQLFMQGTVGKDIPFHDFSLLATFGGIILFTIFDYLNRAKKKKYGFDVLSAGLQLSRVFGISVLIFAIAAAMIFYRGIPFSIVITIALVLLFTFITNKTVFGRQVYAIGGNKEAARLSGINIRSRTMMIFVIMGMLSALSGIVFSARLDSAASSSGNLFELDAIAAAIIGGTSTLGGEGTIIGAIIGALVMGSLNNGMSLMGWSAEWQMVVKGLVLLLAVLFDRVSRSKKA